MKSAYCRARCDYSAAPWDRERGVLHVEATNTRGRKVSLAQHGHWLHGVKESLGGVELRVSKGRKVWETHQALAKACASALEKINRLSARARSEGVHTLRIAFQPGGERKAFRGRFGLFVERELARVLREVRPGAQLEYLFVDMCAGVGGFSEGAEWARTNGRRIHTVAATDGCPTCCETLEANFDYLVICADLVRDEEWLGDLFEALQPDGVVASFPCQPFCRGRHVNARRRKGQPDPMLSDERATLMDVGLRVTKKSKARTLLLENVEDMLISPAWRRARNTYRGWVIQAVLIDCSKIWLPQTRERAMVVMHEPGKAITLRQEWEARARCPPMTFQDYRPGTELLVERGWEHPSKPVEEQDPWVRRADRPTSTVTTKTAMPIDREHYVPRERDEGSIADAYVPTFTDWACGVQGFPENRTWPPDGEVCECELCHPGTRKPKHRHWAKSRQVGNAVPPPLGKFVMAAALASMPRVRRKPLADRSEHGVMPQEETQTEQERPLASSWERGNHEKPQETSGRGKTRCSPDGERRNVRTDGEGERSTAGGKAEGTKRPVEDPDAAEARVKETERRDQRTPATWRAGPQPLWPLVSRRAHAELEPRAVELLELEFGVFTAIIGSTTPDVRQYDLAALLQNPRRCDHRLDDLKHSHVLLAPVPDEATPRALRRLLHLRAIAPESTVVAVVDRCLRPFVWKTVGRSHCPNPEYSDHEDFRVRARKRARWDVWYFGPRKSDSLRAATTQIGRQLRKELHNRLRGGKAKDEIWDGGASALDWSELRRAAHQREDGYHPPGTPPDCSDPRKLAAGAPYREQAVPAGSKDMDRTVLLTEAELRLGPTRAAMRALGNGLRGHRSRVMKDIASIIAVTKACKLKEPSQDQAPLKLPFQNNEIRVRQFAEALSATVRAIPEVAWHVEDKNEDDFERRKVVKSQKNARRQASALAAAACARAALEAVESYYTAARKAGLQQPIPELTFRVRDVHDRSPVAHSPLCAADIEDWHRDHCTLCREVVHSERGFMGFKFRGGVRHHPHCYFARVYARLRVGLWYEYDRAPNGEACGGEPLPDAVRDDYRDYWHRTIAEHPEATRKGLRKWDATAYSTRPVFFRENSSTYSESHATFDRAVAVIAERKLQKRLRRGNEGKECNTPEAWSRDQAAQRGAGTDPLDGPPLMIKGYDFTQGSEPDPIDKTRKPLQTMAVRLVFRNRDLWVQKTTGKPAKPRVVVGHDANNNDFLRKPLMRYNDSYWVTAHVLPGDEGGVDDLVGFFINLPLHPMLWRTQVYRDPETRQWRMLVCYGFGSKVYPFYASQLSTELIAGLRGNAARQAKRWDALYTKWKETHTGELTAPFMVEFHRQGSRSSAFVDDLLVAAGRVVIPRPVRMEVSIAAVAQRDLRKRASDGWMQIEADKSIQATPSFIYLGMNYNTRARKLGSEEDVVEISVPMDRRAYVHACLRLILERQPPAATLQELRSLRGTCIWVSLVMRGGRAFLAETNVYIAEVECSIGYTELRSKHRHPSLETMRLVPGPVVEEIQWLVDHLDPKSNWKGSRVVNTKDPLVITSRSDAAGALGYGYFIVPDEPKAPEDVEYFTRAWHRHEEDWPSFTKELVPVHHAVLELCRRHQGRLIVVVIDNSGVALAVNAGRAFDPRARQMMKDIAMALIESDCEVLARWVDREGNLHADELSRQKTMRAAWEAHCNVHGGDPNIIPPHWELHCTQHLRRKALAVISEWMEGIVRVRECQKRAAQTFLLPSAVQLPATSHRSQLRQ